uniref:F-box domain-containing protein n=3 Tax=Triticinae TaxID=1648030 RepID=A0A453L4J6_AEGTS
RAIEQGRRRPQEVSPRGRRRPRRTMGLLALKRLVSVRQDRKTRSRCGTSIAPVAKRKCSPCQQQDDTRHQAAKRRRRSVPELPKDIWDHILSLLPLRDAARAGCVSRALSSSWTRLPNLTFTRETLGLTGNACRKRELARTFENRVYRVLRKHSGGGVKTFKLHHCGSGFNIRDLNRWLQIAVTPGIEEVVLSVLMMFNTPILPVKFLYLKNLRIFLHDRAMKGFSPGYDYFSLVSFLDACPVLENFVLAVLQASVRHELISGDPHLRQMPEHRHGNIKNVTIKGFCAAKSMVELTCHILENATSLECLTLDTICDDGSEDLDRTFDDGIARCCYTVLDWGMLDEGYRGLRAIERYIVGKVPSTVKLNVYKLSSRRYAIKPYEYSYANYLS